MNHWIEYPVIGCYLVFLITIGSAFQDVGQARIAGGRWLLLQNLGVADPPAQQIVEQFGGDDGVFARSFPQTQNVFGPSGIDSDRSQNACSSSTRRQGVAQRHRRSVRISQPRTALSHP